MSTGDTLDKLVVFLAKRDGIGKLVKTFQYVSNLAHWGAESSSLPELAQRAKSWETASGLSRKAFRSGRFLTGFNALRRGPPPPGDEFGALAVLANAGEMVYFFFDHFAWLSRVGVLEPWLARRASYVSSFGEAVGYVFFVAMDLIMIRRGLRRERKLLRERDGGGRDAEKEVRKIRTDRVMRLMATAANVADLVIAVAETDPNPFCNHAVTLGISGLVSAWAGWYRNWPS